MTNKAPFCASLRLIRTVFTRLKIPCNPCNPWLMNYLPFLLFLYLKNPFNPRNLRLIKNLRLFMALYNCKETFTDVNKTLQINLFMQNKANFQKVKLNVTKVLTKDYDQLDTWSIRTTKPIQSQLKPIQSQLKPILCQNKANSNPNKPKQTQFKPKQTQNNEYMRSKRYGKNKPTSIA